MLIEPSALSVAVFSGTIRRERETKQSILSSWRERQRGGEKKRTSESRETLHNTRETLGRARKRGHSLSFVNRANEKTRVSATDDNETVVNYGDDDAQGDTSVCSFLDRLSTASHFISSHRCDLFW